MTNLHKSIGGYFELELPQGAEYHSQAIALNTGRNTLEYILRVRGYKRVYLPYYSCEVLLEPFKKLGIEYTFYHINANLEPEFKESLSSDEAILYINYFGLKQGHVEVCASVGLPLPEVHEPNYKGYFAINVLHSEKEGTFQDIHIEPDFEKMHVIEKAPWVKTGNKVSGFTGANQSLGTIFLRFDTREQLNQFVRVPGHFISVITE